VENGDKFQTFSSHPIRNYVRRARNYKFTCAHQAAWPSHVRLALKKFNAIENSLSNSCRCPRVVLGDVFPKRSEMADSLGGPDYSHLGALLSVVLPHERSHFDTFSWLTDSPRSSSLSPVWISPSCHSSASTNAAIASAARNDFERLDLLANASSLFFTFVSSRTDSVSVEDVLICIQVNTILHNDLIKINPTPLPI